MKKFRLAIIGAGSRANQAIYPAFNALENVEIVAICDIDKDRLNKTADKYGVEKRYGDNVFSYRDMLNEIKPDGVAIIGSPHVMYDLWMWTLKNGFNLYVEKPLALSMHQVINLVNAAKENDCKTAVSLQRRSTPVVMKMKDKCLEKGPITHAVCRFYKCEIHPFVKERDHMMDDTVHAIDTLRWACGGEVVKVESMTKRVGVPDINFISATLHFDNGATGYLINSWSSGRRIFDLEMHAPGICAEVEHEVGGKIYADGDTVGEYYDSKGIAGSDLFSTYTGVTNVANEWVTACIENRQAETCFENTMKTMKVAEIILAQSLLADR